MPFRLSLPVRSAAMLAGAWVAGWLIAAQAVAAPPSTRPVEGLRENTPAVYAIIKARLVTAPGQTIETGTLVVRDGVIEAVGADLQPPADARVIDLAGKTIYAGFVDAYSEATIPAEARQQGAAHWNPNIGPQLDVAQHYKADEALNAKLRSQGITARLVAPGSRIIKGQSALVSTGEGDNTRVILKSAVAQHFELTIARGGNRDQYPNSPMGAVALARQTMLDADWYAKTWAAWQGNPRLQRPERNDALAALAPCASGNQPAILDAANEQFFLRADAFAREFGLKAIIRGSGREYRRLPEVAAAGRAIIVPVNFPQPPNVGSVEDSLDASLAALMHWDHAPENPARLDAAGVAIAFTSHGLKDPAKFLESVRQAVARGLKADSALKALTTTPAQLLGLADRLGKLAPGMQANLVVADGDLFNEKTRLVETWVDGRRYEHDKPALTDVRGAWSLELAGPDDRILRLTLKIEGTPKKLSGALTKVVAAGERAEDIKLAEIRLDEAQLRFRFEGKTLGKEGPARATATVSASEEGKLTLLGALVWADGASERLTGERTAELSAAEKAKEKQEEQEKQKKKEEEKTKQDANDNDDGNADENADSAKEKQKVAPALYPVNYPFGDFGRASLPEQPKLLAFKNARLWTCGPEGIIENATLLVGEGKILAAGQEVTIPDGATIIDAAGRQITPGIIDCHSHMASDGGINEGTQAITAEVRIGDFVDADDITIYRQLAGGVTAANVLHGSANPIGGQNQVIKLRWGALGEQLKFAEAPPGIKFALGENVKQSNWGDQYTRRYPQSRMGVEQLLKDAFAAAREYQAAWQRWNDKHEGAPPRRDLELEALAEIVAGKRWIHCHSYRQDEILALIRVCDENQITIGSLQHILEGYKVADAMAKHGAMGSSFSDWWAYKIEVIDAIPYNGALMHRAGVVVSFNSDDGELGRHLNHEAAKAVKYGGVEPTEALKFVTLNPARQLRIDRWVGSLEAGKHADFVVWSGDPLSPRSRCDETWIDGRKYFDREADRLLLNEQAQMRAALIRKVLESGQEPQKPGEEQPEEWELWPRYDEFCTHGRLKAGAQ